ncbi:class II aldolase/adducin family protein [Novosphingobium flavum]|uniref:Class II aldolase/adducin family protein n=1 Tax=Novosphingobium aerophilum TaxID=2839843 RepID=A0A7X1KBX2_9SPHN|nr:class II aldolase/adducin family protein [Novosphingobium aerophilum]MBC2651648.1 class II aldolase/adducin family protein [Novosphingobium aerophilum]MBC2661440.1 class II aldolase/adducin family protein [Novosphingobium aerophilum]
MDPAADDLATERRIRRDLAAFYRLAAHFGWDDLLSTHISARLPDAPDGSEVFLINPYGLLFEEVTASSLVKINGAGEILEPTPYRINRAGFVIHSAVHHARPDAGCVVHLHTRNGVAVSATRQGLLPLNQSALIVGDDVAYHDFEGVAFDMDEQPRFVRDLGVKHYMILRNHGTLAIGATVAEAFSRIYFLEWSCDVQVRTLAMGAELYPVADEAIAKVPQQTGGEFARRYATELLWPAMLRKVERLDPAFAD